MWSFFYKSICQVGIFMICSQAIIHFRPNRSYEKYLKLLVSVMILIQLLHPVVSLIGGAGRGDFEARVEQFREQLAQSRQRAEESAVLSQERLGELTLSELRKIWGEREEGAVTDETGGRSEPEGRGEAGGEPEPDGTGDTEEKQESYGTGEAQGDGKETGDSVAVEPVEQVVPVKIE